MVMNLQSLVKNMESKACPAHAAILRKYMKSGLVFWGLRMPVIKQLVRDSLRHGRGTRLKELYPGLKRLWKSGVFEQMMAAIYILERFRREFDGTTWHLLDEWIDGIDNWALCDGLGILRVNMIDHDRKKLDILLEWTKSPNMWRRRSAAVSLLKLKRLNSTLTIKNIEPVIKSLLYDTKGYNDKKEFFIQKAIGWLLRSYGDSEPEAVLRFVDKHRKSMSNLAIREATRKIKKS